MVFSGEAVGVVRASERWWRARAHTHNHLHDGCSKLIDLQTATTRMTTTKEEKKEKHFKYRRREETKYNPRTTKTTSTELIVIGVGETEAADRRAN